MKIDIPQNKRLIQAVIILIATGFTYADSIGGFDISDTEMSAMYIMLGALGIGPHIIDAIKDGRKLSVSIEDMTKALKHPDVRAEIKKLVVSKD